MKYINQAVQYFKGKIDSSKIDSLNIVNEIVKDLQEIVGFKHIVLAPAVSPGTSLQALKMEYARMGNLQAMQKEYARMGKELNGKYRQNHIDQAVAEIHDSLEESVWG